MTDVRQPRLFARFLQSRRTMFTHSRSLIAALLIAAAAAPLAAQASGGQQPPPRGAFDPTGVPDTSMFAPLNLPPGNEYRSGSGAAGPRYWQQRADYDLRGTLDTAGKAIRGEMTLRYTNNSPDTLRYVWFQVEQNAFRNGSLNSLVFPAESRFGARNFEGGDVIDRFNEVGAGKRTALKTRVEGTVMRVDLDAPLAPGKMATFDVAWHFNVPEHGADRMGRDASLYEIAQWYPRVCVYDDLRGWNTEPYLGQGEFYLEYGDYSLALTVPAGYIVSSTGVLQNPSEVLTPTEISRLARAAKSDTPIHIVTQDELTNGSARPRKNGMVTWRFAAKNVRDAVWAASPEFLWDASSWQGKMANAYYRESAMSTWADAADQARMSIMEYSERWFQYPYPQISVVEGPISGMEYPMLAMENKSADKYELYNVITHEIGHQWYPMVVGSNERMHMWQDEGFNTFINYFAEARRYPEKGDYTARIGRDRAQVEEFMRRNIDEPLEVQPDRINPNLLGENAYVKTAVALGQLRDEVLGPQAFDDAFREYTRRWAFKHPSPDDFFKTMEDASGKRLDWFFREWFLENEHFDVGIDTLVQRGDTVGVRYRNYARGVLPLHVRLTLSDGSTQNYDYPAEIWSTNTSFYDRFYTFPGKRVTKVQIDPDNRSVDIDRANNVWPRATPGKP
jgi:hypothetical protein